MSNTSKNLLPKPVGKDGRLVNLEVADAVHLYKGAMVAQETGTGYLTSGSTSGAGPCIGVSQHEVDNSTGADGAKQMQVETERVYIFANGADTDACSVATLIGSPVYMLDDHTVADNDNSGALKRAGYFMGMEPDGNVRVLIVPAGAPAVSADPGALTFTAVAGTANQTLEAMADPTDTPATADALRDDIVANLLPKVRNNFADVATQLNAIRTALVNAGLMA